MKYLTFKTAESETVTVGINDFILLYDGAKYHIRLKYYNWEWDIFEYTYNNIRSRLDEDFIC